LAQSIALLRTLFPLCYMWYALLFVQAITMASKDPKMSKQCTGRKRKNITLTIPQKLRKNRRH